MLLIKVHSQHPKKPSLPAEWGPLKPSTPAAAYTSSLTTPLKKIINALTGSQKPSTPSPVARADYVSPYKEKYWAMMTKNLRQKMKGMKEAYILEAIKKIRNENPEYSSY